VEFIAIQLIIVATVWGAHHVTPTLGFWGAFAWSIGTLAALSYAPAIIVQIAVIWGTYFGLRARAGRNASDEAIDSVIPDRSESAARKGPTREGE
jgi:hypothetical protein